MAFDNLKKRISEAIKEAAAGVAATGKASSGLGQTVKTGGIKATSTVQAHQRSNVTVKLPQAQSARQKMLFQEEEQEKWYLGDQPTTSEVMARIYTISQDDPTTGEQLWNAFQTFQNDPSSPVYNPYAQSTNKATVELGNLGFDMSGGITQKWLEENAWLKNHYRTVTGVTPLAPSNSSTPEQNAAYWYYKATEAEDTTQRAETEWAALQEEIRYWTGRTDRNYSDDEVLARIDWNNYPTLARMDEDRKKGTPTVLNRSVGYSQDALYGVVWAARNESTGDPTMDSVKAALGHGTTWQEDSATAARLDPTNAAYSPYAVGSTADDAALYFGVSEFPSDWLENNRAYLNSGDATARRMYQQVFDAEQTTLAAEAELEGLWAAVDEWMKYTTDPDVILSGLLDERPTLQKMDKSRKSGDLLSTTRAIDYRWEDVEAEVRRRCEAVNTANQGGRYTEQVGAALGLPLHHSESDLALERSRDNAINAGAVTIMAQGTDEEKSVFQTAYSSNFDTYLVEINAAMNSGVTAPQGGYTYCLGRANEYAGQHYLTAKAVVAPYEAKQQEVAAAQEELDTLESQLWVQQEQHYRDETESEAGGPARDHYHAMVSVDGGDWEIHAERIEGTNQYRFVGAYNAETGEFLDPIPGVMSTALSVKGEMFAESLNPKEAAATTERSDYTPEEQEAIMAHVEELEGIVTSGNAYLESNAPAYVEAQQTMQRIDSGYAVADRMAALAGLEKGDSTSTRAALDFVYAFGAEYKPTEWATQDLYAAAMEQGYDYEAVSRAAVMGKKENENAIAQIVYAMEWLEQNGVEVDQTYLDNMQREWARLEREVKAADYFLLQGNEDFASVIAETSATVKRPFIVTKGFLGTSDEVLAYYAVNPIEDMNMQGSSATWMPSMTDLERQTYLYLYGKEGPEAAREYYDYLTNSSYGVVPVRTSVAAAGVWEDLAHDLPVTSTVLSVISSPLQLAGTIYSGYSLVTGQEINPYHGAFGATQMVGTIRGTVKEDITTNLGEGTVENFLANLGYDAITAAGDSLVNAYLMGGVSFGSEAATGMAAFGLKATESLIAAAPMGAQAASSAIRDAKLRGANDTQAMMMGGATFLAETLTEAITVDNVRDAFKGGMNPENTRGFLRTVITSGMEEAPGEMLSEAMTTLSDEWIMGKLSNRTALVQQYLDQGMSPEDAEAQANLDIVKDILYHGKPKPLRKLRINTASFQKWFSDPSGDLTNPDGTPRIIYRGTHSKLYMEHQAGSHSGQVINFYTPDLGIAQSYAAGSSHKIKTYDIANWETAAKAMKAEGFELREVQQGGEWGYQAFGIENATLGSTGSFYRENELARFNKEYGGIHRAGLYEGYISIKNPLVIDAHGAPYTRTHATVKDKDGNDFTATMKNREWGEWAAQNGYGACIVRNTLDYLYDNHSGRKPGTVIMTFSPTSFKSKYNTGKLGKTNPDIRYHKAGSFALTGEPISRQMQDITKRLAAGQMVDVADIMATPEVQWAEAHQLADSSIPYRKQPYTAEEMAELVSPERASLQQDIQEELMALGSAVVDKDGETPYTGPVKQEKMLDIVIGPPAAGKSSALADPISQLHGSRILDSDMVKERLPEYQGGLNSGYLHNESRYVWTQMQQAAIQAGDNVVLPIVGHDINSVLTTMQRYKDAGYSVQVHYLELDGSKTLGRALNRFLTDGRYIDPTYLAKVSDGRITQVYEQLKEGGLIDEYSHWSNDVPRGEKPTRIEGSALQHLHGGAELVADSRGDGGEQGGPEGGSQAPAQNLKYAMNTPQQQPQGVSSTPKGTPKSSPAKIAKDLVKALGLGNAVGTKRMNRVPQAVAGCYEARARYIAVRSRQAGNYTVTMHEVFHNLADRLNMTGTQDMVTNLDPVFAANYTPAELPGEAFAEFGWRYMESETLARQFAGDAFVDQFEARLRQAGLQKTVHNAARQLRIWLNATVNDRIGATIVDKNKATKPGSIHDQLRAMISQHIDDTAAAEPVNASIRKESGNNNIPLNQDVRANALMKNFASRRAYAILTENLTDANWNVTGESLASRFERVGLKAKDAELLNEYMLALHSLDRDAQGKPVFDTVGVPADQRQRLIDDVQQNHPEVAAAEKEFQAFRKEFLRAFLVDTGYLSQADFDKMNAMYPHYVPTYRIKNGGRRGGSSKTYRIRRASGSTEDIINPMDSFVSMVDSVVTMVSANNAALAWDSAYRQNEGLGAFGREITPDMHQVSVDVSRLQNQIAQLLSGNTDADVFQQVIDLIGTRQIQWVPQSAANMANVITVQRSDGSVGYYEMFDPELYKLLSSQRDGSGSSNKLWSTLGKVTRAMSMLTTGSNPVFAVRNFMRDFQNSVNYGSWASNYGSGFMKWMRAAYDVWTKSGEYQDYVALGGGGWTRIEAGTKKGANAYRSALYKGYNTSSMANAVKWAGQKVWDTVTLSRLNEVIEQTSRFAEYRYGKHDKSTSEGKMEAFLAAQDVTVDFARMGNSGTASVLKQLVPFLGASTQGVYRTGRSLTEAERGRAPQRFAKTVINTALASAISAAIMLKFSDDEEKEAFAMMSDDLKAQHLYFPNFAKDILGQQPLIRIPLAQDPLTYAIHGAVTDAIWNGTTDEMVIDVAAIANTVVDNLNPFGNGTIFEPLLAVTRNKNWYGSRIVPSYMGDWDASTQYTEETPGLFVAAGRALNMSPLNIQYLAEQYSGFLGQMVVPAISRDEAGGLGGLEATIAAVQKRFTSDPLISNDVVGSVYDNAAFLTQVTDAAKNNRPANMLRRGLSEDERNAAYQEAYDLTHKGGIIADAKTFLSDGYDRIDEINANDTLTPEQKYTLTSDVRREMIKVALEANEAAAAYNEKYVAGLNIATNALYEGAYLTIPTAMDKLDQVFKADSDQMYMQRATEVWEATGNDSALPHPNTSYTSKGVTYEVGVEDMENWMAQYKMGYQDYLVRKGARWDAMSDEEKLELLKSAHSAGHDAARKWHMKLHGIK